MTSEEILVQFLTNLLPATLLAKTGGASVIVVAFVAVALKYIPVLKAYKRWSAPLLCLIAGQVLGFAAVAFDFSQALVAMGVGLLIAISAIGMHSGAKNVGQAVRDRKRKSKAA